MHQIRTILLYTAIALCTAPGVSFGQPSKPEVSKSDLAEAKTHFRRAEAHKDLGEYEKAAAEYLEAYGFFPNAEFYFNAGEMYRLGGDKERAVEYFEKYLAAEPEGRVSKEAKSSIERLTKEIEAARRAREEAAKAAARDQRDAGAGAREAGDGPTATPELVGDGDQVVEADEDEQQRTSGPRTSGRAYKIAGVSSAVVGLLAVGLGVKYGLDASSASDDLSVKYDPDTEKRGESAERNMFICYGVGAAALIAGGVLYYVGHGRGVRYERARAVSLTPRVDGEGVTLWVQGRF